MRIYRVHEADKPPSRGTPAGAHDARPASKAGKPRPVELLREIEKFSKKPIQQLAIIKEANVLVSLSDGFVAFYDLQTFDLAERFEQTKGATTFAVISNVIKDSSTQINSIVSRLAVAVKKKILLWTWQDMELDAPIELSLPATVKSIAWLAATKMVIGMDPGYVLVDIDSQNMVDIFKPTTTVEAPPVRFGAVNSSGMGYMGMSSWIPKPLAAKLAEGEMLLARDVNSLFIGNDAKAFEKRQITWASAPEAIGYSYPYMLSLHPQSKRQLEVRNPETLTLLQSIPLTSPTLLHVPQPNISLAHAGKGFLVAGDRAIWRMNALGYDSQFKDLLARGSFDEALSLIGLLEDTLLLDKEERIRDIKVRKAKKLFADKRFVDALDLFSEAEAPPDSVISLYPPEIAGSLAASVSGPQSMEEQLEDESASRPSSSHEKSKVPPTPTKKQESDAASIKSSMPITKKDQAEQNDGLSPRELRQAVQALSGFLAQTRKQIQRYLDFDKNIKNPEDLEGGGAPPFAHFVIEATVDDQKDWLQRLRETAVLVDTSMFRAYMFTSPSLAGSLFRLDNFCDPKVVEEKLYENSRYAELIDFLGGKKLHQEALELLEKLAKDDDKSDIEESLKGPRRTVEYLQQLPFEQIDLILRFAKWPLEADPGAGMQVFVADTANAEELPRDRVYEFLREIDLGLAVQYLEHVISEYRDPTPEFHESLADAYIEKLCKIPASDSGEPISTSLQERLEAFVASSTHLSSSRVLKRMPEDDPRFFESRATLHDKQNEHLKALDIYVFRIRSPAKAEAYCNAVHLRLTPENTFDSDPADSIYAKLLSLYLAPPEGQDADLEAALDLLSRHGSRIPALSLLEYLPKSLSVDKVESYFRGRMRAANTVAREAVITRALYSVEKARADMRLQFGDEKDDHPGKGGRVLGAGRNRRVVIGEETMCPACDRRFGRQPVRVWPSGEVRHYACGEPRSGQDRPQQRILALGR